MIINKINFRGYTKTYIYMYVYIHCTNKILFVYILYKKLSRNLSLSVERVSKKKNIWKKKKQYVETYVDSEIFFYMQTFT